MKTFVSLLLATAPKVATAACTVDDHHPVNGGYHIEGIAGHRENELGKRVDNPNSGVDYFYPWHNASWAPGIDYPDGSNIICTGPYCSEECKTQGCPKLIESTTCAQIRFCFTKDSGSDVWLLPSEQALANCDFTEATAVCSADEGEDEDCCNYVVEEDAELTPRFFASKVGCEQGQRAAVRVADYDDTGDQCFGMGLGSSRINKCECELAATLVEPCHSEFLQGCLQNSPDIADDDPCCAAKTCIGRHQNITDPVGQNAEKSRKLLCNDAIPGNCATDGESDCCSKTCSECGIDLNPFAKWSSCTSGDSATTSGSCGYKGYSPHTCDFTACDDTHPWHPDTEALKAWLTAVDPPGPSCYDTSTNECGCTIATCTEVKCTATGGVWTDTCPEECVCPAACQLPNNEGTGVTMQVDFTFDKYPEDTGWTLSNTCSGSQVVASGEEKEYAGKELFTKSYCVPDGTYEFIVTDAYSDGLMAPGDYTVSENGIEMISMKDDTSFTKMEIQTFGSADDCAPPDTPTKSPTPTSQPVVGACYDMGIHQCGCTKDTCTAVKCAATGGVWSSGCPVACDCLENLPCQLPDNGGPGMTVKVDITFDQYPEDTSWTLSNMCSGSKEVASGKDYTGEKSFTETYCVLDGTYDFTVLDAYGDGLMEGENGDYTVTKNGVTVISYDQWKAFANTQSFGEPDDCASPFEKVAGYFPNSQVTDHCAIDLDQKAMESELSVKTDIAFVSARKIYTEGGYSKSYALVTVTGGLTAAVAKGVVITGEDSTGGAVYGKAYSSYEVGATELKVQYKTSDIQASYVNCQVGGLPAGDTNTAGCLVGTGTLFIDGTSYSYTYNPATDNNNGRTLQGFSTAAEKKMLTNSDSCPGCPYDDHGYFNAYYGVADYADEWVTAAFESRETTFTNGNADFSQYAFAGRDQAIKKGTAYQSVFMYVIREFEDALDDCQVGCINCNDDPVHAWDEGVCFYTGSLEGTDGKGSGGKLLHSLAEKRCGNFKTCGADGGLLSGPAQINTVLMQMFAVGRDQLLTSECIAARETKNKITDLMYVPLIQGTLRYAYKVGELGGGEKEQAEGTTFAAAVLPKVHAYNTTAANIIYDNMKIGAAGTMNFRAVKAAFESVYVAMNVECAHVGGLWDDENVAYYEGLEPCYCQQSDNKGPGIPVVIDFTFDQYPAETSWTLFNTCSGRKEVASGGDYQASENSFTQTYCVPDGTFDFTVLDVYGDGLMEGGNGDYTVTKNGVTMITYDQWRDYSNTQTFGEPGDCASVVPPTGTAAIRIDFAFDDFPMDISWELFNTCNGGRVQVAGVGVGGYGGLSAGEEISETYYVQDGIFELKVTDSYQDGMASGDYTAYRNNVLMVSMTPDFKIEDTKVFGSTDFCVGS